ncbi:MAG: ATP-binding protein [Rhodobacteraceae bacterium]|nr:MAG: ATP-binding protein [Paracoccaceae bacterium]
MTLMATERDGFAALRGLCAAARARLEGGDAPLPDHPRLREIVHAFGLSPFEQDILVLAAGIEVDEALAPALRQLDPEERSVLSFALPLARLEGAHWSALSPQGPLRRWELIRLSDARPLARAEITLDERILHHLVGLAPMDTRLAPMLTALPRPEALPEALAQHALQIWRATASATPPLVEIDSDDPRDARALAAAAAAVGQRFVWALHGPDLGASAVERRGFATLWTREVVLAGRALLIEGAMPHAALAELASGPGMLMVHGCGAASACARPRLRVRLAPIAPAEQDLLWRAQLGQRAARLNGALDAVTRHFTLGYSDVTEAAQAAAPLLDAAPEAARQTLWNAARAVSRPRLRDLAQEIVSGAGWDDLILPERETRTLRAICAQVRQRQRVYGQMGFTSSAGRGLGVSVLFAGPSGAGKTMAAEVLARDLDLDLFRIDLSQVVSKYIGETEKNLAGVFDAAEDGGAILLFDEADALFGKRSEVRDSHDRYANMEVAYLLQRLETYRGLAILTTNFRAALDKAFARRLRFVVEFPFPGYAERLRIWQRAFPAGARTEGLDPALLAKLSVAGGAIRNIALTAAFLAAEADRPIRMADLAHAAEAECAKLDKTLTEAETGGWT